MSSIEVLLSVKNLKKHFPAGGGLFSRRYVQANEDISLDIHRGETFGLVGESGSGKSTFGRTVLQLYKPTAGEVVYYGERDHAPAEGVNLAALPASELRRLRKELQIVFQDPYSSLDPRMTVGQLVEEGVATHGYYKRGSAEMKEYIREVMEKCGLRAELLHRYPHQFSGGQRQRICIARALSVKPKFVVCDECVSALDVSIQSQILNLLTHLKEKEGLTYLFISHDLSVVRYISDRIGVMYLGKIVEWGNAEEVFENPAHPYTRALISAIPGQAGREKILLSGNIPSAVSPPSGCPFHTRCFMAREVCQRVPAPVKSLGNGHFAACHFVDESKKKDLR